MKKFTIIFLISFLTSAIVSGQGPATVPAAGDQSQSLKGVVLKKMAPVSTEVLRVKLPKPVDRKLKNGLPLVILENHRVPTVTIDLVLPASPLMEPADLPGLASATAEMMRLGTKTRSSKEIAEALSELGASLYLSAEQGGRSTHMYVTTLSENLDVVLDIMADVLLNPTFPQDELDKWKNRQLANLQQMRSSEGFLAAERQRKVLFPSDARSIIAPTPEAIKKITPDHLIAYYKKFYKPGNSIFGVTGDVTPAEITSKLEKRLAAWETGTAEEPKLPLEAPIAEKKIFLIDRPNSVQTYLLLTNRAIDRMHPDYVPVQVANRILGGGPAGRLFRNIREDKGYTYGAGSSFTASKLMNYFTASSSVRTEVTGPALDEFLKEFRDLRERPVPKEELENAKRAIVANFALGLENQSNVLRQILQLREYRLPDDYWDKYPERVMAVTAQDVQQIAKKYVPVENLQLIAVGDAKAVRETLRKYGTVAEYNTEGMAINSK